MKNKKNLKKIIIGIIIVIVVILGLIFFMAFKELQEEDVLKQEIVNYSNKNLATDDYSIKVKTTGDRAYVEEAVKKYYKNLSDNVKTINNYLTDENLTNILSLNSLKADSPTFVKSHTLISNTKNKVSEAFKNISNLCEEDTIKNLIDKDKLSDSEYYYDFYLDLMYTKKDLEELKKTKEEMEKISNNLDLFLDKVDEILTFLETNANYIEYTNTNIEFENNNLLDQYNKLINDLTILANNMSNQKNSV